MYHGASMADSSDNDSHTRKTFGGFGPEKHATKASPTSAGSTGGAQGAAVASAHFPHADTPAVDVDLIYERRSAPLPDQKWTFVEVWTRNTIYALDAKLRCIEVINQANQKPDANHALLHARLVGGQRRTDQGMELSHPFPRPGSEAVFEQVRGKQVRFTQTSTVTRVVLRLRVLSVASDRLLPTWGKLTGSTEVEPST